MVVASNCLLSPLSAVSRHGINETLTSHHRVMFASRSPLTHTLHTGQPSCEVSPSEVPPDDVVVLLCCDVVVVVMENNTEHYSSW